jgi:hypothetical protein
MSKIKLEIGGNAIEVEGEDAFIEKTLKEYKDMLTNTNMAAQTEGEHDGEKIGKNVKNASAKSQKKAGSAKRRKKSYSIPKDLNLQPNDEQSLVDFYSQKAPSSAMEKTTVFVYYLTNTIKREKISLDDIYACYKEVKEAVPAALRQNVADTSFRKGWLDTSDFDDIKMAIRGENLVEKNLPRAKAE